MKRKRRLIHQKIVCICLEEEEKNCGILSVRCVFTHKHTEYSLQTYLYASDQSQSLTTSLIKFSGREFNLLLQHISN